MAALNITETEHMGDAVTLLQYILTNGYDPAKAEAEQKDPQTEYTKARIKKSLDQLKTIRTMKGHYFS